MKLRILTASIVALLASGQAYAVDPNPFSFDPLSAPATAANTNEASKPFLLPSGWTQMKITDRNTLNTIAATDGSSFPSTFGNWDMIDVKGPNVYIPMEVQTGAGVIRYNRNTGAYTNLMVGNNTGTFNSNPVGWSATNDDFGAFDPAVLTPKGSLVVAEEWSGNGRIFEISNPETATGTGDANVSWLSKVPSVSHEGVKFGKSGEMYFIDEDKSGSIYRFMPKTAGDYNVGKTSVLVDADMANGAAGDSTKLWDDASNAGVDRTGAAQWVDITDMDGNAITTADPFDFANRGGRTAADEVNGTPYGRPEDLAIDPNTNVLYFATTSENIVYSIDLIDMDSATVKEFVNSAVTKDTLGNDPVGEGGADDTYGLDDPDNLELVDGVLYIIEDENPGDIWAAKDTNGDGVADYVGLFASLGPFGSEPTGFIADPEIEGGFLVAIQHPSSGNDALWSVKPVPVPAAVWFMGTGLLGLLGAARRRG